MRIMDAPADMELIHRNASVVGFQAGLKAAAAIGVPSAAFVWGTQLERSANLQYVDAKFPTLPGAIFVQDHIQPADWPNPTAPFNDSSLPLSFWKVDVGRRYKLLFTNEPNCHYDKTSHKRERTEEELQFLKQTRCMWNTELDATNGTLPPDLDPSLADCYE